MLLCFPYTANAILMPIFTENILKVGAKGMGILISNSGIGAIVGSLVLASLPNKKRGLLLPPATETGLATNDNNIWLSLTIISLSSKLTVEVIC